MQRGMSIYFQVWFQKGVESGAMFLVPIQAIVWKSCDLPESVDIQPWDVFSSEFSCSRIELFNESGAFVLPKRLPGRYMMTFDFTGNELSDDLEQHKMLHLIRVDGGWFSAVPNNRVLIEDMAFLDNGATKERPDFTSLSLQFKSE
jgi:hypothetical protein